MTKVTKENVRYLAQLCRIACSEAKVDSLLEDFQNVVSYVEQLNEIDTSETEPCSYVTLGHTETPLREDIVEEPLKKEEVMANAPSTIAGLVRVPSVLQSS